MFSGVTKAMQAMQVTPAPSADGVWQGLRLAEGLAVPDVALPEGTLASVVVQQGQMCWVGPDAALPAAFAALPRWQAAGLLGPPGLVGRPTHLGFRRPPPQSFSLPP